MQPTTDICLVPSRSVGFQTKLINLEPFRATGIELIASGGTAGRHVGHERASIVRPLQRQSVGYLYCGKKEKRRTLEVPSPPTHWTVKTLPGFAGTTSSAFWALRPQVRSGLLDPLTGPMSEMSRIGLGPVQM